MMMRNDWEGVINQFYGDPEYPIAGSPLIGTLHTNVLLSSGIYDCALYTLHLQYIMVYNIPWSFIFKEGKIYWISVIMTAMAVHCATGLCPQHKPLKY